MYLWNETKLADLGVITRDDYRSRGVVTRLVRVDCKEVLTDGYVSQYGCQTDNEASVAIALASGFSLFGPREAIVVD